jgi:hypothetical protein
MMKNPIAKLKSNDQGTFLAYQNQDNSLDDIIYVLNIKNKKIQQAGRGWFFSWFPDGGHIAIGGQDGVFIYSVLTNSRQVLQKAAPALMGLSSWRLYYGHLGGLYSHSIEYGAEKKKHSQNFWLFGPSSVYRYSGSKH